MRTIQIVLINLISFLFILTSCNKEQTQDWYIYEQTKCADSWDLVPITSASLEDAVTFYLNEELEVAFDEINIVVNADAGEDCEACSCKTGTLIRVKADVKFSEILTAEGFVLE